MSAELFLHSIGITFVFQNCLHCFSKEHWYCYRLAGDYESLIAGNSKDALVDMTGGVGERLSLADYKTAEQKTDLFRILKHSKESHSLMSASIAVSVMLCVLTTSGFLVTDLFSLFS